MKWQILRVAKTPTKYFVFRSKESNTNESLANIDVDDPLDDSDSSSSDSDQS